MAHHAPVSVESSHDPLTRMRVFQLAAELIPDAFEDAKVLRAEPITEEIAGQLTQRSARSRPTSVRATHGARGRIGREYSRTPLDRFGKA
jgi:hypothetical protein